MSVHAGIGIRLLARTEFHSVGTDYSVLQLKLCYFLVSMYVTELIWDHFLGFSYRNHAVPQDTVNSQCRRGK
jgi:hypothetical protein